MTADDLTRLRAVAEAATPGPWTVNPNGIMVQLDLPHDSVCDMIESRSADAEFIATFDPPTVLALIDRVERAERWSFEIEGNRGRPTKATIRRDGIPVFIGQNWSDYVGEVEALRKSQARHAKQMEAKDAELNRLRGLLTEGADDGQ